MRWRSPARRSGDSSWRCTCFRLGFPGGSREVRLRLLGRKMAYAALAALTVAIAEGRDLDAALAQLEPTPGRMQPVGLANGAWLLRDEYTSATATIDAALDVLVETPARRIVVLGDVTDPAGDVVLIKGRSTQRLERIALLLEGREVGCDLAFCKVASGRCERCPMLERGWPGQRTAAALFGHAAVAG